MRKKKKSPSRKGWHGGSVCVGVCRMRGHWGVDTLARLWGFFTLGFPLDIFLDCFLIQVREKTGMRKK